MKKEESTYCGFVAIVGRPNVGKSTLLNQLLRKKISITSKKPNTTRYRIMGVCTKHPYQTIYIDTPGISIKENKKFIDYSINSIAMNSINYVETVIFVIEGIYWTINDQIIINKLRNINCIIIIVINKIDKIAKKERLLPHIKFLSQQISMHNIIPICAERGTGVDTLIQIIHGTLPKSKYLFPKDYITNCSQRFIISEIIREKLMRFLGDELPYSVETNIKKIFVNNSGIYNIHCLILIKRNSQKKIIIGNKGKKIKSIGVEARRDIENIFEIQVYLKLWVKVGLE